MKVVVTAVLPWTAAGAAAPFRRSVQQAPGHPQETWIRFVLLAGLATSLWGWGCGSYDAFAPLADVGIATSGGHVITVTNDRLEIDNQRVETLAVRACDANALLADPDYQYDASSQRWFSTILNGSGVDLAISDASAPDGPYYACYRLDPAMWDARIDPRTGFIDSPRLTVTGNKVAIVGTPINCSTSTGDCDRSDTLVINKADAVAGRRLHTATVRHINTPMRPARDVNGFNDAVFIVGHPDGAAHDVFRVGVITGVPGVSTVTTALGRSTRPSP